MIDHQRRLLAHFEATLYFSSYILNYLPIITKVKFVTAISLQSAAVF